MWDGEQPDCLTTIKVKQFGRKDTVILCFMTAAVFKTGALTNRFRYYIKTLPWFETFLKML